MTMVELSLIMKKRAHIPQEHAFELQTAMNEAAASVMRKIDSAISLCQDSGLEPDDKELFYFIRRSRLRQAQKDIADEYNAVGDFDEFSLKALRDLLSLSLSDYDPIDQYDIWILINDSLDILGSILERARTSHLKQRSHTEQMRSLDQNDYIPPLSEQKAKIECSKKYPIATKEGEDGYIDCYIDIPAVNELASLPQLPNQLLIDLLTVFNYHFGLQAIGLPFATRIAFTKVNPDPAEVAKAKFLLKLVWDFEQGEYDRPITKSTEAAKASAQMQHERARGLHFKDKRTSDEQMELEQAFQRLIALGAKPWEMYPHQFHVRNLRRGFLRERTLSFESIKDLVKFSRTYVPK